MKKYMWLGLAACVAVAGLGAATASPRKTFTVTAPDVALRSWTATIANRIGDKLVYPHAMLGQPNKEGLVAVKFMCSDTGAPADVAVLKTSGSRTLDAAALRAVTRIKTLHPLPIGLQHDQRYVAMLLFANTQESYDRQITTLKQNADEHNRLRFAGGQATAAVGLLPPGA